VFAGEINVPSFTENSHEVTINFSVALINFIEQHRVVERRYARSSDQEGYAGWSIVSW
jgi:hypothetical protein